MLYSYQFYDICSLDEFKTLITSSFHELFDYHLLEHILNAIIREDRSDLLPYIICDVLPQVSKKEDFSTSYFNKKLNQALIVGKVEISHTLLELGYQADPGYPNLLKNFWTHHDVDTLKKLQDSGFDIHHQHDVLFRYALIYHHLEGIHYLITQGASADNNWGIIVNFIKEIDKNSIPIIHFLIEHDIDIHQKNSSLLKNLLNYEQFEMIEFILGLPIPFQMTPELSSYFIVQDDVSCFYLLLNQLEKEHANLNDYHESLVSFILKYNAINILKECHLKTARYPLQGDSLIHTLAYSPEYQNKCSSYLITLQKKKLENNLPQNQHEYSASTSKI